MHDQYGTDIASELNQKGRRRAGKMEHISAVMSRVMQRLVVTRVQNHQDEPPGQGGTDAERAA